MRKKSLIVRYQTSIFDLLSALRSDKYEEKIVLVLEDDKILRHPQIFRVLIGQFHHRLESIATDSQAIRYLCETLHITTIPLSAIEEGVELSHIKNPLAKMSILEYFLYECRRGWWHTARFFSRQKKNLTYKKPLQLSGVLLMLTVLSLSCVILFFVMYFSITRTTIEIIPEVATKSYSRNVVLTTHPNQSVFRRENEFSLLTLSETVELEQSFEVNTFDSKTTKNAKGVIKVSNELPIEQQLRTGTRFVSQSGVVFRSLSWIKLPPMRIINGEVVAGSIEVPVVADTLDDKGVIIGTRGNIGTGIYLTIPALKFNQDKIYAESVSVFSSGENPNRKVLTQDGYDRYAELYREKLRLQAIDQIKDGLKHHPGYDEKSGWEVIPLFHIWDFAYSQVELKDGVKVGSPVDNVVFHGKVQVTTYAYPRGLIEAYMTQRFYESTLPEAQEVRSVDARSMNIEALTFLGESSDSGVSMKSTLRIQGDIMYNFSHPNNLLLRQMRNLIVGKKISDAKTILANDPNIADVSISVSPFFLDRISSRIDAIDFYIHSQE